MSLRVGRLIFAASLAAAALIYSSLWMFASAQTLPRFDRQAREGVAACAGPCHARQSAIGLAVGADMRGSEIMVWQDATSTRGRHSTAYAVLREARGRDIAAKLGLKSAESAPECLSCHADLASGATRGERFQIADGVTCEACHGGAGPWLSSHYAPTATHAQNVTNGLYDTQNPTARAKLCQSCHLGTSAADQFVSHRLMGAGHPRLSFELELFTSLQAHHFEDDAYQARKPIDARGRLWAIGQAQAGMESVRLFVGERGKAGLFPELTFFDCHSCHRPISDQSSYRSRWVPNAGRDAGPGTVPFNDAHLIMTLAALTVLEPSLASDLDASAKALQQAVTSGSKETAAAADALRANLQRAQSVFGRSSFSAAQCQAILAKIVGGAVSERFTSYQGAEQAIMAIDSLSRAMADAGGGPSRSASAARSAIEEAYKSVSDPNTYDPDLFKKSLNAIGGKLGLNR
jgi:hypothetical protein